MTTAVLPRREKRTATLPIAARRWLVHGRRSAWFFLTFHGDDKRAAAFWHQHADAVVHWYVRHWPGTRPLLWWRYDSPEPRRRLGGTDTPLYQCSAYGLVLRYGIPVDWRRHGDFLGDREIDIHPPINPDDAPRFESEAAYLLRLNLLFPGELARLLPEDFEPEEID